MSKLAHPVLDAAGIALELCLANSKGEMVVAPVLRLIREKMNSVASRWR